MLRIRATFLPHLLLALLACTILVPRAGRMVLNPDDAIPLLAALLGLMLVLKQGRIPRLAAIPLLLIWCGAGLLSATQTATSPTAFLTALAKGSLRALNSIFLFVLVLQLTYRKPERVAFAVRWIVRVSVVLGLLAVLLYAAGTLTGGSLPGLDPIARSSSVARTAVPGRFSGPADAANFAAAFFLMTIPLTVVQLLGSERRTGRGWYALGLGLQLFGLVVTFTRASVILLVLLLGLLLVLLRRWRLLRVCLLVGLVLALVIAIFIPEYLLRFTEDSTGRLNLWTAGLRMMADYPLFGVGFGNFLSVARANPARYPAHFNPHNSFIMLGAEGGVLVLVSAVLLAVFSLAQAWQAFRRAATPEERLLTAGLLAGMVGFWLQNMTNDLLLLPKISTYFWLYYALAISLTNPARPGGTR